MILNGKPEAVEPRIPIDPKRTHRSPQAPQDVQPPKLLKPPTSQNKNPTHTQALHRYPVVPLIGELCRPCAQSRDIFEIMLASLLLRSSAEIVRKVISTLTGIMCPCYNGIVTTSHLNPCIL